MNASVRADRVHPHSLALETARRSASPDARQGQARDRRSALVTAVALGIGGVLTLVWTGALIWIAGYLLGFW